MIVKLRDAGLRVLRQKRDVLKLIDFCDDRYARADAFVGTFRKISSNQSITKQFLNVQELISVDTCGIR